MRGDVPFYDDWRRVPTAGLTPAARAAWVREDWPAVASELVAAAVAGADAGLLAAAVETDARTLEVSFLAPFADAIESLPDSAVKDAALAFLTVRAARGDRGALPAQAAIVALVDAEPRLAASVAVGVGMILLDRARWSECGWFVGAAREAIERMRAAGRDADSVEPLWFSTMALAVLVEWNTYAGDAAFRELGAALAVPRARNLLRGHHAAALVAIAQVHAGRGDFGAAAVSVSRAVPLLDGAPLPQASALALLVFVKYRQGHWAEARRSAERLAARASDDDDPWMRSVTASVAVLAPATTGDFALAAQLLHDAELALEVSPTMVAAPLLLHARLTLVIAGNDWSAMLRLLDAAREPGYRLPYTEHEMRALQGMALRNAGQLDRYRALVEEWERLPGATEHPYYWAHRALLAQLDRDGARALEAARTTSRLVSEKDDPLGRTWARIVVGTIVSHYGDATEGIQSYEAARAELAEIRADGFVRLCTRIIHDTAAALARATGDTLAALTTQQRRVAELVAEGYTSAEVGQILYLSKKTIDFHVANILSRLGLASRRELKRRLSPGPDSARG
ncbi:LuxR C-terminal-related transcriptional regulator [Microbacterium sp. NPDC089189]|uniref:LuxR C-terminal-related transcriptional regulator n=1 Tax=Microbacterium sp. NPDC089189 TaxID=3154972 RepID=UPI00343CD9A6